jgi:hypothetical protein
MNYFSMRIVNTPVLISNHLRIRWRARNMPKISTSLQSCCSDLASACSILDQVGAASRSIWLALLSDWPMERQTQT